MRAPVIGIVANQVLLPSRSGCDIATQTVFNKYLMYVTHELRSIPLVIPSALELMDRVDWAAAVLDRIDGLLLPGAPSNVGLRRHPETAWSKEAVSGPRDHARDSMALQLIVEAIKRGIPLLGICRGMQEINVALGGGLHVDLSVQPGFMGHRAEPTHSFHERYMPRHSIRVTPGCLLDESLGGEARVNSLHGQGVSELGLGVSVLARSVDGLVEAIEVPGAPALTFGVQWHTEWGTATNGLDRRVAMVFSEACRKAATAGRS